MRRRIQRRTAGGESRVWNGAAASLPSLRQAGALIDKLNTTLRTAILVVLVLIAGWWTLFLRGKLNEHERELEERNAEIRLLNDEVAEKNAHIDELDAEVARQAAHIRELDAAMRLLKVDHRLARIEVLEQSPAGEADGVTTRLRFTELDAAGEPVGAGREVAVSGRRVYVESLVVKFGDDYVEAGDFLRGTSVCLFRRVFGENQRPAEGTPLDAEGRLPVVYAGDETPDPFYDRLWERFWDYANDPEEAAELGVRAIHGEAPFMELRPGGTYLLELRASGGLSIRAE